ncbi:MAG: hypothetical protein R2942_10205 [Ignavibacteria bacterium]
MQHKGISIKSLLYSALPSIIVIIISIFFDSIYQSAINKISGGEGLVITQDIVAINLWWYPVLVFMVFILCLIWAVKFIAGKIEDRHPSETEVIKTIGSPGWLTE